MEINEMYFGYLPFSICEKNVRLFEADDNLPGGSQQADGSDAAKQEGGQSAAGQGDKGGEKTLAKFMLDVLNSNVPLEDKAEVEQAQEQDAKDEPAGGALDDGASDAEQDSSVADASTAGDEIAQLLKDTYDKMQKELGGAAQEDLKKDNEIVDLLSNIAGQMAKASDSVNTTASAANAVPAKQENQQQAPAQAAQQSGDNSQNGEQPQS